jgi:putative iron-only hydrogenase system regulator
MESRAAIIAIILENTDNVDKLNGILHEYSQYILGRMGIPYRKKNINIISIAVDAPHETISVIAGEIGKLGGVNVQVVYSK